MGETPKLDPEGLEAAVAALADWRRHAPIDELMGRTSDSRAATIAVSAYLSSAGLSVSLTENEIEELLADAEGSAADKLEAALASSGEEGDG